MDCRMTMIRTTKRSISQETGNIFGIHGREKNKTSLAYREFLGPKWIGLNWAKVWSPYDDSQSDRQQGDWLIH